MLLSCGYFISVPSQHSVFPNVSHTSGNFALEEFWNSVFRTGLYIPISHLANEMVPFSFFVSFYILCMNQTNLPSFFLLILTIFSREVRLRVILDMSILFPVFWETMFVFFYFLDYASVQSQTLHFYFYNIIIIIIIKNILLLLLYFLCLHC